jgi:uncharacterized delta-60 repeat protein
MRGHLEHLDARRLLSAGDFDPGFGTDGRVPATIDFAVQQTAVVPAGVADQFFVLENSELLKVDANGAPITSFGTNGHADTLAIHALALQSDGKIVLVGDDVNLPDGVIVRLNADGTTDASFAPDSPLEGFAGKEIGDGEWLGVQSDGKIVINTRSSDTETETGKIFRLNADGSDDPTFHPFQYTVDPAFDWTPMLVLSSDKILIGGGISSRNHDDIAAARLNPDGSIDTTFGTSGFISTSDLPPPESFFEIPVVVEVS